MNRLAALTLAVLLLTPLAALAHDITITDNTFVDVNSQPGGAAISMHTHTTSPNDHYAGNRPPLLPSPLIKLPTGSIKPRGWLRKQLELETEGFTGHLTEIGGFCRKEGNAWLNPKGEGNATWEEVPYWKEDHSGLVDKLQPSPVKSTEPLESVTLIPMGAARLRLAATPVLGDGPDARQWQLPAEPLSSYSRGIGIDPYEAMFDGKLPKSSNDRTCPRFTTYCFGGAEHGKLHWVQKKFDQETTVSSCEVYWYDETQPLGDVRLPKWWRVLYKSGTEWKEVENPSGYRIERDTFNIVTFTPVQTSALRLDVQCQNEKGRWAMGILEWRIK